MIKAVFFDIDGTILNSKGKMLPSTLKAIESLHQQGIICGISSGRGPKSVKQLVGRLPMDCYVLYNGQLVFSHDKGIYEGCFKYETLEALAKFGDKENRQLIFGGRNKFYGSQTMRAGQRKIIKKMYRLMPTRFSVINMQNIIKSVQLFPKNETKFMLLPIFSEPIYQCVMLCSKEEQSRLEATFSDCSFTRSNPYSVDIIPKGGSKMVGIQEAIQHYQLKASEVVAFGDSWNDLEMIEGVGIGVAMGNAEKSVKEQADFVTFSNDKDGIYQALKTLKIIS